MPERVDEWDDDVAPVQKPAAASPSVPVASMETAPLPGEAAADGEGEDDPDRHIPWRQAVRGAPTWIWLIAIFCIGSICVMMATVVLLLALLK